MRARAVMVTLAVLLVAGGLPLAKEPRVIIGTSSPKTS